MATLTLDPESLGRLLTSVGPPAFTAAECAIESEQVVVTLRQVKSGMTFFGKDVGHFDIRILLSAKRLDDHQVRIDWELGQIVGVPTALARMIAKGSLVQGKIRSVVERLGIAKAVELDADNTGALVHIDRLPWMGRGVLKQLTCQRFDIPGGKTHALSVHLALAEAGADGKAATASHARAHRHRH